MQIKLNPIGTAPRDGTYILLFGDSGYNGTPLRAHVGHYDAEYRPRSPWVTHSQDSFLDDGGEPKWWLPMPVKPDPLADLRSALNAALSPLTVGRSERWPGWPGTSLFVENVLATLDKRGLLPK